jgi:deoxyxylulose-5-phosphate synthase
MKSSILDSISSPEDLKNLSFEELGPLCTEIRQTLIQTTAKWRTSGVESGNSGTDGCTSPCF